MTKQIETWIRIEGVAVDGVLAELGADGADAALEPVLAARLPLDVRPVVVPSEGRLLSRLLGIAGR